MKIITLLILIFPLQAQAQTIQPIPFDRFKDEQAHTPDGINPEAAGIKSVFLRHYLSPVTEIPIPNPPHIIKWIRKPNKSFDLYYIRYKGESGYKAIYVIDKETQKVIGYHLLTDAAILNPEKAALPTSPVYKIGQLPLRNGYWSYFFPGVMLPSNSLFQTHERIRSGWVERYVIWSANAQNEFGKSIIVDSFYPKVLDTYMEKQTKIYLQPTLSFDIPNLFSPLPPSDAGDNLEP